MVARDSNNLQISGADAEAAAAYDAYVGEFLSYGAELRALFSWAEKYPDSPLLNAHAAALHMAFEGAEGWASAEPYSARSLACRKHATAREALFCEAVDAWRARSFEASLSLLDELTVRWPADLCALKWAQYHAFNLGDQAALLRFAERARIVHEGRPYVHGMTAFALEQNHRLAEAESEGLRAVEVAMDDAWAHHAVAHVYETQRRAREGAQWLERCAHFWDRKGVFIRDHNWWHAALFRLALGRPDEAIEIYDRRLWGAWPEFPQEQIGAVSMLWRLELRGLDVGTRWAPVVEQARRRAGDRLFPFHDIHYLYALARAGQDGEAERLLASLEAHAGRQIGRGAIAWGSAGAPAARGALFYARGEFESAAEAVGRALPHLSAIGGSHAQRHLFIELFDAAREKSAGARAGTAAARR